MVAADVILFGIQSGVRLFGAARQAYVEQTQRRELVLPLPGLDHIPTLGQAQNYFLGEGRAHLAAAPTIAELHAEVPTDATRDAWERDQPARARAYIQAFVQFRAWDTGRGTLSPASLDAATAVTQWKRGEGRPSALQRVAGTLIEIGIDYFATGPGTITGNTPQRKFLASVLAALDDESFQDASLDGIVETLFVASLDGLTENPGVLTRDERARTFVAGTIGGLAAEVKERLESLPEEERLFAADSLGETAGLVARSLIRHGAATVLENPTDLLGVPDGGKAVLVEQVGKTMLDILVPDPAEPAKVADLFTEDGVDRILRSVLTVVSEHPELVRVGGDAEGGIRKILTEVAKGLLADPRKIGPDLAPELARLVLERTGANLGLLVETEEGEPEHLLVTAATTLMGALAGKPDGETEWRLTLGRSQILDAAEAVLDEVAENPALVTSRIGARPSLQVAVEAILTELAAAELDDLSPETVVGILKAGVRAAALRADFLDRYRLGDPPKLRVAVGHVIDAIFSTLFPAGGENPRAAWRLAGHGVLVAIVEIALDELSRSGVDREKLAALKDTVGAVVETVEANGPFTLEAFRAGLRTALAAAA